MNLSALTGGAAELGIDLDEAQLRRFAVYAAELVVWNRRVNLTRIVDPVAIQERHFLDSLTCALPVLAALESSPSWRCIDVGSGAGFPGLPLAIAFPSLRVTLLEATGKKVAFLDHLVRALELTGVTVLAGRAEEVARDPRHRDGYDLACARALAPLSIALELCLPFVRPGGVLVLPRGSDLLAQLDDGRFAAAELGGRLGAPVPVAAGGLPPGRALVVADKLGHTDPRYPRRVGLAASRPLGRPKLPLAER
jgi:16S rRNA (guanine527-N7)-methyltransferase